MAGRLYTTLPDEDDRMPIGYAPKATDSRIMDLIRQGYDVYHDEKDDTIVIFNKTNWE